MDTDGHGSERETAEYAEHAEGQKGGWGLLRFLWIGCVVLVLYVLSVGPLLKMDLLDRSRVLGVIYSPLYYLDQHSRPADAFFDWYVYDVWKVRRPFQNRAERQKDGGR